MHFGSKWYTPPTGRILSALFTFAILPTPTTIAQNCDTTNPIAARLATTIDRSMADATKHSWHVHATVPASVSGLDVATRVSFDVPSILSEASGDDGTSIPLTAVFHAGAGGDAGRMATYVAQHVMTVETVPDPQDDWTVTAKLTSSGSMGHLFPVGDEIFFAYESEKNGGNTIALRLYPDLATLVAGGQWRREVRLQRQIALPDDSDGVTTAKGKVINIGTPTITRVVEEEWGTSVHLRFHYYPEGPNASDYPGVGHIVFPPSGENSLVVEDYAIWYGRFDTKVDAALRTSQVEGKIGLRAPLGREGRPADYLLLEAQMAENGGGPIGWLSWRPILYKLDCDDPTGSIVPLTLPTNLQTFANPRVTHIGAGKLLMSFFVPSEPFNSVHTADYAGYDSDKCPSCAANPMEVATDPARPGTLLIIVEVGCVLGDDDTFKFKYKKKTGGVHGSERRKNL
eukprot:CAMPEP_0198257804 /NCGR_PEP_ID=MMETSP1447-20131203/7380_1 /TAXON_ID=420782 /ORGANISM="Chaetoceros dichaeta, Strain CCMP1751" /LENGTH=456 /DNA_ID=CAMNT_0043944791 /DNA_START=54 /DNA_END=1425 /DNA_ORIENTATION=+